MIYQLDCKNCGAKLDIQDDTEIFACSYCGSQQLVDRTGGIVQLRKIENTISAIQSGTDKTAAELAIVRLEKELTAAKAQVDAYEKSQAPSTEEINYVKPSIIGSTILGAIFSLPIYWLTDLGWIVIIAGAALCFWIYKSLVTYEKLRVKDATEKYNAAFNTYSIELDELKKTRDAISNRLATQRKIADGE